MIPAEIAILYATHDGHTRKIAMRVAEKLLEQGKCVTLCDLGQKPPDRATLDACETIAIVAPIRFGYHLPPVEKFIVTHKALLNEKNLALASVNLTARKQGKNTSETNPYLRKWVKRHGFVPTLSAVFGGYLEYRLYSWWERQAIRLIMKITKGPTNLDALVDFTDWTKVDLFASDIAALSAKKEKAA